MPEQDFDDEVVRVELTRKPPNETAAAFARAADAKDLAKNEGQEWLCGYNAAGRLVASLSGGKDLKMMTTTGWQDGREGLRLAEEVRLLRQAIAPSGRNYKNVTP